MDIKASFSQKYHDDFELLLSAFNTSFLNNDLQNKNLAIAVSGGADSIALLYTALLYKQNNSFNLFVVHVEHGIRGKESIKDSEFVAQICKKYNLPLHIEYIQTLAEINTGVENQARIERYNVFNNAIEIFKLHALMLSHHADDQVETILMHMFRGAGLKGITGMKLATEFMGILLLRPFLNISKQDILNALNKSKTAFCDDYTNFEPIYNRNILRLEILPQIEKLYPSCKNALYRLAEQADMDNSYFNSLINDIISKHANIKKPYCFIEANALRNLDKPVAIRVLRKMVEIAKEQYKPKIVADEEYSISYNNSLKLYELIFEDVGAQMEVQANIFVIVSYKYIHFLHETTLNSRYNGLFSFKDIQAQNIENNTVVWANTQINKSNKVLKSDGIHVQAIPTELLKQAVIRQRKEGDIIRPFGMKGSRHLKKYLIDKHIDREFRDLIPILAIGNNVLWAIGVGASNDVFIKDNIEFTTLIVEQNQPWM